MVLRFIMLSALGALLMLSSSSVCPSSAQTRGDRVARGIKGVPGVNQRRSHVNPLSKSTNGFALKMFKQLSSDRKFHSTSIFFSPVSIVMALGMTHLGARGQTSAQMRRAFEWQSRGLNFYFRRLGQSLNPRDASLTLRLANRIWSQQGMGILPSFARRTKYYFDSQMVEADFIRNAERVRLEINAWVENKTENKIQDLLKPRAVDSLTRMVLVNAIYFKGIWKSEFNPKETRKGNFYIDQRRVVRVDMMTQFNDFGGFRDVRAGCRVLELPYTGNEASMFIVVPSGTGIAELRSLERGLTADSIKRWVQPQRKIAMRVFIPKFKVTHSFSAVKHLMALNVTDLFSPARADLSGMTGHRGLYVSAVVHKAFIEVNEQGTEAAAATGIVVSRTSVGPPPFAADRPFLFFIYHKKTKAILFFGRVLRPDQENVE